MESKWGARSRALVGGAAAITLIAPAAIADEKVESELQAMRDMVLKLQDQVQNQQQQLEQQSDKLEAAGLEEEGGISSSLSDFLEGTDFSGSVAVSYFWNSNKGVPGNAGANTTWANPFHPDHNSINVDEVWFSMSREATEESPVGFGIDIATGQLGDVFEGIEGAGRNVNNNGFWLGQAYIDWLTPFGVTLTAGKFGAHIGYEVPGAAYNYTITRGFTYNGFQPFQQIGAKASTDIGPLGVMIGVVNGIAPGAPDANDFKDLIWSISGGTDVISLYFAGEWGNDTVYGQATGGAGAAAGSADNQEALTLNWIVEATPTDALTTWVDVTWVRLLRDTGAEGLAIAVGSHVRISDKLGLTGRFEYGRGYNDNTGGVSSTNGAVFSFNNGAGGFGGAVDTEGITLTAALDYMLAEGLTLKSEFRWDKVIDADASGFAGELADLQKIFDAGTEDDEFIWGAQLVYAF